MHSKWIFIHPFLSLRKEYLPFHLRLTWSSTPHQHRSLATPHRLLLVLDVLVFSLRGLLRFSLHMFPNLYYMALKNCCRCICFILPKRMSASCQRNSHVFQPRFHNSKSRMVCMYLALGMVAQMVKNLLSMGETLVWSLGQEDPLEREWQPTPVSLPGKIHGQRSLVGNSPRGHKELDTTGWLTTTTLYFVEGISYLIV